MLGMAAATTMAMEPGQYEDAFKEKVFVFSAGEVLLTRTWQVGDPESLTGDAIVPYPTVCTHVEYGVVTRQD